MSRFAEDIMLMLAAGVLVLIMVLGIIGTDENLKSETPGFVVITDKETGCQYLRPYAGRGAATPRLGRDGKQICHDVERKP